MTTKIQKGVYKYKDVLIHRDESVISGYFGAWRVYGKNIWASSLKAAKKEIDKLNSSGNG